MKTEHKEIKGTRLITKDGFHCVFTDKFDVEETRKEFKKIYPKKKIKSVKRVLIIETILVEQ